MKIKLRDITIDDLRRFKKDVCCDLKECKSCPLKNANCNTHSEYCWVYNKEMFSDKFLDQEIEIEDEILTEKERDYLKAVIKPFRDRVEYIKKLDYLSANKQYIRIAFSNHNFLLPYFEKNFLLPYFEENEYYKGMEVNKEYTLVELEL